MNDKSKNVSQPRDFRLIVEKDVKIPLRDRAILYADIFRPDGGAERFPAIMNIGPYQKDRLWIPPADLEEQANPHMAWETANPVWWCARGYACVRVDSRGSGKSPGQSDPSSNAEAVDFYDAIEWAAAQPWSSGKVGLIGISYLSIKQWQVAALQPPHLAAICPWEGGCDLYRDWSHHGGIFSSLFPTAWWPRQVLPNQHGNGATHHRDRDTGATTTGSALSQDLLRSNRADHPDDNDRHGAGREAGFSGPRPCPIHVICARPSQHNRRLWLRGVADIHRAVANPRRSVGRRTSRFYWCDVT